MKIKIYRGTKEIGGTCIELTANNGKILWIDLGAPLNLSNPDTSYTANKVDALLISHSHQDHHGLMETVGNDVPIYIGHLTLDMIDAARIFRAAPELRGNFKSFGAWDTFTILGTFKVKAFLVDHSSPEAFAFLIEVDNKRVFYSGDFRATGRKNKLFYDMLKAPPPNIDLLVMEGTMVQRKNQTYPDEKSVELAIANILNVQENVTFLVSSAQNIDRLVSLYNACKRTGKTLVIDVYTAWLLDKVKNVSKAIPTLDREEIRVYNDKKQIKRMEGLDCGTFLQRVKENRIDDTIFENPHKFACFVRCPNKAFLDTLRGKGIINIIYSQWEGYLKEEYKMWFADYLNELKQDKQINFKTIHTSGHATVPDLVTFAKAINPKVLVPIHTENPKLIKEEFEKEGIKNIVLWEDGVGYNL